jgi:hypothetical protein
MSTAEIVAALGYPSDAKGMRKRIGMSLRFQARVRGTVRREGGLRNAKWTLAS